MRSYNTLGAWMSHRHTRTHKTHHNPDLGEANTFPLIVFFVPSHGGSTQMSFCLRTPKLGVPRFSNLGLLQLGRPINFYANLQLGWGLKQRCNPCRNISKYLWHETYMQVNQGDFWLSVVGNQIGTLTPNPFFGHNFCFKYPFGSCEPILDIYVSRAFQ
jgi:hypothetical protein